MAEPAFLVDGVMEQRILQRLCRGNVIRRIGCNGENVRMEVMAKFIDAQIKLMNNRYFPIIIVLDREGRVETSPTLVEQLTEELNMRGHTGQFVIGVPDRMIENWILADWTGAKSARPGFADFEGQTEGCNGKSLIKTLLDSSVFYNEPTLGVELFLCCDPQKIRQQSRSFAEFVDRLNLPCSWLSGVDQRFSDDGQADLRI
jgi:Domain of unknown function (DUF4276)